MRVMKFITLAIIVWRFRSGNRPRSRPHPPSSTFPITNAPSNSGREMFNSYCAVCHGTAAKGDGPAASAMKTAPTDVTALAKKSGGKYPSDHVASVIRGQSTLPSHGSQDMPVWGPLLSSIGQGHEAQVQQRTANLVAYIETLQAK